LTVPPLASRRGRRLMQLATDRVQPAATFGRPQWRISLAVRPTSAISVKETIMSRIRHIAIIVPDAEEAAKFYEQAFGLKRAGKARRGVYLPDGIITVALLPREGNDEPLGLYHFGIWV